MKEPRFEISEKTIRAFDAMCLATQVLENAGVDYLMAGGWAVDAYHGSITRDHEDGDMAIRLVDKDKVAEFLKSVGFNIKGLKQAGVVGSGNFPYKFIAEKNGVNIDVGLIDRETSSGKLFLAGFPEHSFSQEMWFGERKKIIWGDRVLDARAASLDLLLWAKSRSRRDRDVRDAMFLRGLLPIDSQKDVGGQAPFDFAKFRKDVRKV